MICRWKIFTRFPKNIFKGIAVNYEILFLLRDSRSSRSAAHSRITQGRLAPP